MESPTRRRVGFGLRLVSGVLCLITAVLTGTLISIGDAATGTGAQCAEPIPDIYDRLSPAVVSITARSINPYEPTERVSRVAGSGVIFDASGLVLTNSHVVFGRGLDALQQVLDCRFGLLCLDGGKG